MAFCCSYEEVEQRPNQLSEDDVYRCTAHGEQVCQSWAAGLTDILLVVFTTVAVSLQTKAILPWPQNCSTVHAKLLNVHKLLLYTPIWNKRFDIHNSDQGDTL